MKKAFLPLLFLFCVSIAIAYTMLQKIPMATINSHSFLLEVAKTEQEKEIGLAKYVSLPENKGQYFPFNPPTHQAFWMKNMKFSIDIIFIYNKRIVAIFSNVPFPSPNTPDTQLPHYESSRLIDGVLETHAGLAKKYGFKAGDTVIISL